MLHSLCCVRQASGPLRKKMFLFNSAHSELRTPIFASCCSSPQSRKYLYLPTSCITVEAWPLSPLPTQHCHYCGHVRGMKQGSPLCPVSRSYSLQLRPLNQAWVVEKSIIRQTTLSELILTILWKVGNNYPKILGKD